MNIGISDINSVFKYTFNRFEIIGNAAWADNMNFKASPVGIAQLHIRLGAGSLFRIRIDIVVSYFIISCDHIIERFIHFPSIARQSLVDRITDHIPGFLPFFNNLVLRFISTKICDHSSAVADQLVKAAVDTCTPR
ncbi:hypothetical protein D3C78_1341170 [compost metagenome]